MSGDWADAGTKVRAERCAALDVLGVRHGFGLRQRGLAVALDREEALERLRPAHKELGKELGCGEALWCRAEQVHGAAVAVATFEAGDYYADVDALITNDPRVCLGIYVADCCAVFVVDMEHKAVGLVHAGAKGTRLGVVPATLNAMRRSFGSRPQSLSVVLSACIRPPHYEVDFAAQIRKQCEEFGVPQVWDSRQCTGADLDRYYSYRMERGRTGRMLALLAVPH
ncbi:MAG: polyphenol oxidase family protein [Verrucomicrobiota bacterium]